MKLALLSLLAAGVAGTAAAQGAGFYGDVGYTFHSVDTGVDGLDDIDLGALTAHGGYEFTPNLAAEGELSVGIQDEDFDLGGGIDGSVSLNYLIGAYGRVQGNITPQLQLFARAGLVNAELEAEADGLGSDSDSETGAGYGVGAEFMFDDLNGVRVDYTRYDIEDLESDAFTIAYKRKF
ncbi:MAG: porin family protein [Pseudomonadota bacterium]